MTQQTTQTWAREWLEYVRLAYHTLTRQQQALERRRASVLSLPSGLASLGVHTTPGDRMAKVDALIDAERETEQLGWAWAALAEFDAVMAQLRESCERDVLDATWAAEEYYRYDRPSRVAATNCGVSLSTLFRLINTLCDYLDYIGRGAVGL